MILIDCVINVMEVIIDMEYYGFYIGVYNYIYFISKIMKYKVFL